LAAAAGLLWLVGRSGETRWPRSEGAALASVSHTPFERLAGPKRIDGFEACARRDGYAMVLLRAWSEDCSCMTWRVHEDEQGRRLLAFQAGESLRFSVDVTENPVAEQLLVFALADRAGELPADAAAAEQLIACLDRNSASHVETAALAGALEGCLPTGVRLVERRFGGE
jgi:hypothetical protein